MLSGGLFWQVHTEEKCFIEVMVYINENSSSTLISDNHVRVSKSYTLKFKLDNLKTLLAMAMPLWLIGRMY